MPRPDSLPERVSSEEELDALLARPYPELVDLMRRLEGDLMVLGIAGKMGLSLGAAAVAAIRASGVSRTVYGVSRFSDPQASAAIAAHGIVPLRCDLLDRGAVGNLPRVPNVVFMAGRKFGTDGDEPLTWAMNTLVPAHVCEHFAASRIVAFSTGCVYPLVPVGRVGCAESEAPAPVGEYAQSCLGRERVFEHFGRAHGLPVCLLRLNYALDLRYGVLHDLARAIWEGRPVDRTVGHFNGIWQGDAVNQALLALELCSSPATVLNVAGPELVSVADAAARLAELLGKPLSFVREPADRAYLSNAARAFRLFGYPRVPLDLVLRWTAGWIRAGGRSLGKPTHFEVADGRY